MDADKRKPTAPDWPGYETLIRWIHAAPQTVRPAVLAHAVEACVDGNVFKDDGGMHAYIQRAADSSRGTGEGSPC